MHYKKTQIGWIIIAIFVAILFILYFAHQNQWGNDPLPFVVFVFLEIVFTITLLLFYKLTIELKDSELTLTYGIGLIRIKFRMAELEEVQITKTSWYHGLGIRFTPTGMLYNIQGMKAVKIKYHRKGKSKWVLVGTAEPNALKQVLEDNWV
jgi:hypothetical protein